MIIYSSQRLQKVVNKIRIEEDSIRRSNHDRKIKLDQVKKGNDPKHRWHFKSLVYLGYKKPSISTEKYG